jgi:hypothetical protein
MSYVFTEERLEAWPDASQGYPLQYLSKQGKFTLFHPPVVLSKKYFCLVTGYLGSLMVAEIIHIRAIHMWTVLSRDSETPDQHCLLVASCF